MSKAEGWIINNNPAPIYFVRRIARPKLCLPPWEKPCPTVQLVLQGLSRRCGGAMGCRALNFGRPGCYSCPTTQNAARGKFLRCKPLLSSRAFSLVFLRPPVCAALLDSGDSGKSFQNWQYRSGGFQVFQVVWVSSPQPPGLSSWSLVARPPWRYKSLGTNLVSCSAGNKMRRAAWQLSGISGAVPPGGLLDSVYTALCTHPYEVPSSA